MRKFLILQYRICTAFLGRKIQEEKLLAALEKDKQKEKGEEKMETQVTFVTEKSLNNRLAVKEKNMLKRRRDLCAVYNSETLNTWELSALEVTYICNILSYVFCVACLIGEKLISAHLNWHCKSTYEVILKKLCTKKYVNMFDMHLVQVCFMYCC